MNAGTQIADLFRTLLPRGCQNGWLAMLGAYLDIALVEVAAILPDGSLVPSTSIGNNKTWLDQADRIILEVNSWMSPALQLHGRYRERLLSPLSAGTAGPVQEIL